MSPEDLLGFAIPAAFILFWGSEALVNRAGGGRRFANVRWWTPVGIGFFLMTGAITATAPLWLPPDWLARHRLLDLTGLGVGWGVVVGYLAASFAAYWFHRLEHRSDLLWRTLHQWHHSVERVDMLSFSIGHPLEVFVQTAMFSMVSTFVLGLDPMAAAISGTIGGVGAMVSHWNVDTPYRMGFVYMRPEQHCLHHERGVHGRNYGVDLAIWDMLFGTFANVRNFDADVGFDRPSSIRDYPAMLAFADVNGERSPRQ